MRLIFLVIVLCTAFTSDAVGQHDRLDDYPDVFILAKLSAAFIAKTHNLPSELKDVITSDTLTFMNESFEVVESRYDKGFIEINFIFKNSRANKNISLSDVDKERMRSIRWTFVDRGRKEVFDGSIRINYGERFYSINRIIVRE